MSKVAGISLLMSLFNLYRRNLALLAHRFNLNSYRSVSCHFCFCSDPAVNSAMADRALVIFAVCTLQDLSEIENVMLNKSNVLSMVSGCFFLCPGTFWAARNVNHRLSFLKRLVLDSVEQLEVDSEKFSTRLNFA